MLHRDAQPSLLRYLRVAADPGTADDVARPLLASCHQVSRSPFLVPGPGTGDPRDVTAPIDLPYTDHGEGSAVVLLHAVGDSRRAFLPLLEHLPAGHRYLAPDMRGHGDAASPETGYAVGDFAADVVSFLDRRGLDHVTLVGSSSGGLVAQRVAADHPERVSQLVLVGAPHSLQDVVLPEELRRLTDPMDADVVRGFTTMLTHRPLPEALVEAAVSDGLRVAAHVWLATLEGLVSEPPPSQRATIQAPTLVLWGEYDGVLARSQAEALVRDIKGARLVVLSDTGHLPLWECPRAVAAEIAAFI